MLFKIECNVTMCLRDCWLFSKWTPKIRRLGFVCDYLKVFKYGKMTVIFKSNGYLKVGLFFKLKFVLVKSGKIRFSNK